MYDLEHKTETLMHYLKSPSTGIFRIQDLRAMGSRADIAALEAAGRAA